MKRNIDPEESFGIIHTIKWTIAARPAGALSNGKSSPVADWLKTIKKIRCHRLKPLLMLMLLQTPSDHNGFILLMSSCGLSYSEASVHLCFSDRLSTSPSTAVY